jgi:hypothetical protein
MGETIEPKAVSASRASGGVGTPLAAEALALLTYSCSVQYENR